MEICKMMTLSTFHIKPETAVLLERKSFVFNTGLVVYEKGEYGWFIWIPEFIGECNIPEDIITCMRFAKDNGCAWMCLDRDGDVFDEIPCYEWD